MSVIIPNAVIVPVVEPDKTKVFTHVPVSFLIDFRSRFLEDDHERARHYGLFHPVPTDVEVKSLAQLTHLLVMSASLVPQKHFDHAEDALLMYCMSTKTGYENQGLEEQVLKTIESDIKTFLKHRLIWSAVPVSRISLFERLGWTTGVPVGRQRVSISKRLV